MHLLDFLATFIRYSITKKIMSEKIKILWADNDPSTTAQGDMLINKTI
jgi:hypothetical protein